MILVAIRDWFSKLFNSSKKPDNTQKVWPESFTDEVIAEIHPNSISLDSLPNELTDHDIELIYIVLQDIQSGNDSPNVLHNLEDIWRTALERRVA